MPRKRHSIRQAEEKMKMLLALIIDGKISQEKQVELQEEYSYLQREYEQLINQKR